MQRACGARTCVSHSDAGGSKATQPESSTAFKAKVCGGEGFGPTRSSPAALAARPTLFHSGGEGFGCMLRLEDRYRHPTHPIAGCWRVGVSGGARRGGPQARREREANRKKHVVAKWSKRSRVWGDGVGVVAPVHCEERRESRDGLGTWAWPPPSRRPGCVGGEGCMSFLAFYNSG